MIAFTKPEKLNGLELRDQLNAAGVSIGYDIDAVQVDGLGNLLLDIDLDQANMAESIVEAHVGSVIPQEPTLEEKLATLGISVDDLRSLLA